MDSPLSEHMPRNGHGDERLLKQLAGNEKMAELGRLSAGIIHEINTPLSVIAAASQMILCEKDLPDFVTEMVERIHLEVQRLSQLTRGILSFSREEDGVLRETDVTLILREVLTFLRYEIQKRSISVIEESDDNLLPVEANSNNLKQIFLNLIVNALQAMGTGGRLIIRTSLMEVGTIRISIEDTGPGIPADVLESIFDPFFTTKDPGEGTGLGLFVTRQHVERLGGKIEVSSVEGAGTCFSMYFPAYIQE
jgi:signal transduction histidine kinase